MHGKCLLPYCSILRESDLVTILKFRLSEKTQRFSAIHESSETMKSSSISKKFN